MSSLFDFIKEGILKTNLPLSEKMKEECLLCNEILNSSEKFTNGEDYSAYLMTVKRKQKIHSSVENLFLEMKDNLYLNLSELFSLILLYQERGYLKGARDHYFHSIQCFLLGISLFSFFEKKKMIKADKDSLTKLFCICFYHDIGYLYFAVGTVPSGNSIENLFQYMANKVVSMSDIESLEKIQTYLNLESLELENIRNRIPQEIINFYFRPEIDIQDTVTISEKLNIVRITENREKKHSFESGVILLRLAMLKKYYNIDPQNIGEGLIEYGNSNDKDFENFLEIIKAVFNHDFSQKNKLNFTNDFWSCFLMLIDELEDYGRPDYREGRRRSPLVPSRVEISLDSGKLEFCIDRLDLDSDQHNKAKNYEPTQIRKILEEKIYIKSLDIIF